jgi:hypothetical protein
MSTIANKISSDSRKFLSGVKSSTTQNDRTLSSAMNLSMRLDGKEIELSQKRRMLNAESFIAPQQIADNFQEGYISGYQIGITQGIKQGIQLGQKSVTSPLEEFFKGLPPAAIAALTAIPALGGLLDFFLPEPSTQPPTPTQPPGQQPPTPSPTQPPTPTQPPGQQPPAPSPTKPAPPRALTPEELKNYNRAYNNKDNPFAKGQIRAAWNKMTPDQKAAFLAHAKSQGHDWSDYGFTVPTQVQPKNSSTSQGLQSQSSQTGNAFKPAFNAFNLENMGTEPPGAQLLVMRQPIVVTKKEMGNVVNNGSQLAVIVSGDQRRSDFINYAQRIT